MSNQNNKNNASVVEEQLNKSNNYYDKDKKLQTLSTILDLQQLEKQLFTNLENSSNETNIAQQENIVNQINDLSKTRINLFNTLRDLYQFAQDNVNENRTELVDKMTVAKVMETQLNNMKQMMNELEQIKNNKLRMVQINTYYGKQYQAQTDLMKLIIKICIVIIVLISVSKMNIIPSPLINLLIVVVIGIGSFLTFRKISDLSARDNMDFDRYDTTHMNSDNLATTYDYDKDYSNINMNMNTWSICGDGTTFDNDKGQCIVKPVESFSIMNNEIIGHESTSRYVSGPMEL